MVDTTGSGSYRLEDIDGSGVEHSGTAATELDVCLFGYVVTQLSIVCYHLVSRKVSKHATLCAIQKPNSCNHVASHSYSY